MSGGTNVVWMLEHLPNGGWKIHGLIGERSYTCINRQWCMRQYRLEWKRLKEAMNQEKNNK